MEEGVAVDDETAGGHVFHSGDNAAAFGLIPKEAIVASPKATAIFPTLLKGP